MPNEGLKQFKF